MGTVLTHKFINRCIYNSIKFAVDSITLDAAKYLFVETFSVAFPTEKIQVANVYFLILITKVCYVSGLAVISVTGDVMPFE